MRVTQLKLVMVFTMILCSIQNITSQDLESYFIQYYKEGNISKIQEVLDLGLDPTTTRIEKQSLMSYVVSNSENESKTVEVLEVLVNSGMALNDYALFQQIVQQKKKLIIDFLLSKGIASRSISVINQDSFSTEYLLYLGGKGFNIDNSIISNREFATKKAGFIKALKSGNKSVIKKGLDTFMSDSKMSHVELYYAIKTKDTSIIDEVLSRSFSDILNSTYSLKWKKTLYGNKPSDFNKSDYPLTWAMGTNELFIVKYLLEKGAKPLELGNSKSNPAIQKYVGGLYNTEWHQSFNANYSRVKSKYLELPNFSSYTVLDKSLLKEMINKKVVKKLNGLLGLFSNIDEDFFIELKFLINENKKVEEVYIKTSSIKETKSLKQFLNKQENKNYFANLFKRIKHKEILYKFTSSKKS